MIVTEPEPDFRRALDALSQRRDWPALLDAARQAAEAHAEAWEPVYHQGRALLEMGEYEHADRFLLGAMERFPTLPQFAALFGFVGARSLGAEESAARWESLHGRLPDAPGIRVGLAQSWRAIGRPEAAERLLEEGIARTPESVPLLVHYADAAAQRKDWDTAARRWHAARTRAPERIDLAVAQIGALRQAGRLDEAEVLARQAVAVQPTDPDLNTSMAAVAAARDDWATVASCLRRVTETTPRNLSAWIGLTAALVRQERLDEAEAAATAGLAHHKDNEALLAEYAGIASKRQNWIQAALRWKQVYKTCPPRQHTYFSYADALLKSDQLDAAEVVSAEAIGFAPDDRALLMQNAEIATARQDPTESKRRWTELRRKYPDDPEVTEAATAAVKTLARDKVAEAKDEAIGKLAPVRGSIRIVEKPKGPERPLQSGPIALDRLKSGLPPAPPKAPPPKGVGGLLRLLFGK
jgi:tetratricopeptide (TPR) repeat protein